MPVSQDAILEKLKNVIDPELFVNIVDLGLIYEVKVGEESLEEGTAGGDSDQPGAPAGEATASDASDSSDADSCSEGVKVQIDMTMTSPACPAGPQLIGGAKQQVATLEGVNDVEVRIVMDPPWTPDRMTEDAKDQLGIF